MPAVTTNGDARTSDVIGGAIGEDAAAAVGQKAGRSTDAIVGAGIGGASGGVIGKILAEPDQHRTSVSTLNASGYGKTSYIENTLNLKKDILARVMHMDIIKTNTAINIS